MSFIFGAMTRALNLPPFESSEFDTKPTFNVLIAYEDLETGKHAKQTYDFLAENLGPDYQFVNQMWKFEVLCIPKLRELAAKDAALADIVMISCHGKELPPEVKAWIELWLAEPTHALALVALFDRREEDPAAAREVRSYLAAVAKRAGIDFFAQPDEWPGHSRQDEWAGLHPQPNLGGRPFSTIASPIQRQVTCPRWGINE